MAIITVISNILSSELPPRGDVYILRKTITITIKGNSKVGEGGDIYIFF